MAIEMRTLKGSDTFKMLGILGKLGIKDDFEKLINGQQAGESDQAVGAKMMASLLQTVMVNIGNVEEDLNTFLADLTGKTVPEIQELDFSEYAGLVKDFFKKPELLDFFKSFAS